MSCTDSAHEKQHWFKKHITKINTVILKGMVKHIKILFASTIKNKKKLFNGLTFPNILYIHIYSMCWNTRHRSSTTICN